MRAKDIILSLLFLMPRGISFSPAAQKTDDLIGKTLGNNRNSQSLHPPSPQSMTSRMPGSPISSRHFTGSNASRLACQSGCSYCCHGPVHLTPLEVLNIVLHINSSAISVAQRADWRERITARLAFIGTLAVSDQLQMTIPCPFLFEGRCSIYAVRPLFCRGRNVIGVDACKAGYADPSQQQQYEIIQEQMLISQCLAINILSALKKIGLPDQFVDLSQGTIMAFDTPDLVERWLGGENVLAGAELTPHSER